MARRAGFATTLCIGWLYGHFYSGEWAWYWQLLTIWLGVMILGSLLDIVVMRYILPLLKYGLSQKQHE